MSKSEEVKKRALSKLTVMKGFNRALNGMLETGLLTPKEVEELIVYEEKAKVNFMKDAFK